MILLPVHIHITEHWGKGGTFQVNTATTYAIYNLHIDYYFPGINDTCKSMQVMSTRTRVWPAERSRRDG
jgi:hypothetical protein